MTTVETGTAGTLTPVADRHLVVDEAMRHAVRRDLNRLDRVLGEPVTAVRREAIARHVRFLLELMTAHFAVQDERIWPAVSQARPDLTELGDRVRAAHSELAGVFDATRNAAAGWTDSAAGRLAVRAAIRNLAAAVEPVLDQDAELLPVAWAEIGDTAAAPTGRLDLRVPTRAARRLFWLLDDLEPLLTDRLLRGTPRAAVWVLRNGFSGAYNRGSYLMWVGGGTGPAV